MFEEHPFPTRVADQPAPHGRITTRHLRGSIVESRIEGHLSVALLRTVLDEAPLMFRRLPALDWLVDLSDVHGFDPAQRVPGAELFVLFRTNGGRRVVFMSRSGLLRMLISTVAFAMKVPIRIYDVRDRALEDLVASAPREP